jgi:hypothetical protein
LRAGWFAETDTRLNDDGTGPALDRRVAFLPFFDVVQATKRAKEEAEREAAADTGRMPPPLSATTPTAVAATSASPAAKRLKQSSLTGCVRPLVV